MPWTDEQVSTLTTLWNEGLTAKEIGTRLGMSKNAVIGKVHRLALKGRPSPIKRTEHSARGPGAAHGACKPEKMSIMELGPKSCRWPIGNPRDPGCHFCGKEVVPGKPYCKQHVDIAYVSPASTKKRSLREGVAANGDAALAVRSGDAVDN